MKPAGWRVWVLAGLCAATVAVRPATGQTDRNYLAIVDEKLDKLRADIDELQFQQKRVQEQLADLQTQVQHLRENKAGVTTSDLTALEAKIKTVDEARVRENKALVDQLAKELAALGSGHGGGPPPATGGGTGTEHVVQKGETLSTIAKQHGVTVENLAKANGLTNPNDLKVGQKLVVPK